MRLWLQTSDEKYWQRDLVRDTRRLMREHQRACQTARGLGGTGRVGGA